MKAKNKTLLLASATCAITLLILEIAFRLSPLVLRIEQEELFSSRMGHFLALPTPPEVILLGNSRLRHGVDTRVAERLLTERLRRPVSVWNFGMGGVMGQTFLPLALRILDQPVRPRLVIMFLMPADLLSSTPPELAQLTREQFWKPTDLAALWQTGASFEELSSTFSYACSALSKHRTRLLEWLLHQRSFGPPLGPDFHGYTLGVPRSPADQHACALARAQGYRSELIGPQVSLSELKIESLRLAVERLSAAGVRVILVHSPASSPIRAIDDEAGSVVPEYLLRTRLLAEELKVPIFDHRAPQELPDAIFSDGDHLGPEGAIRYTTQLTLDVILPKGYDLAR